MGTFPPVQQPAEPGGKLGYSIGANFAHYNSTITSLPEDLWSSYPGNAEQNIIGQAPNALFGYRTDGIFQNQQEVDAHADQVGKRVGALRYVDLNKDGVIDALDQEYDQGNGVPKVEFGVNFRLDYKNFDLSIFTWARWAGRLLPMFSAWNSALWIMAKMEERPSSTPGRPPTQAATSLQ